MNVLVVGSSLIDMFLTIEDKNRIKLTPETVTLHLGDKIPINIQTLTIGGNGANVSVGLSRLGVTTSFFTYLGNDMLSHQIENTLRDEHVALQVERGDAKNTSLALIFNFDSDRIVFSHHELREHGFEYPVTELPTAIYLTSMGDTWENAYRLVTEFAKKNAVPLAFSPGSHQLENIGDVVLETLRSSKFLFVNKDEAGRLLTSMKTPFSDITSLLEAFHKAGIEVVSITDGAEGAYAMGPDGASYKIAPYGKTVVERTGAGDSYATAFFAAHLEGLSIPECMKRGVLNAYSVMQHTGAQTGLLKKDAMQKELEMHTEIQALPL